VDSIEFPDSIMGAYGDFFPNPGYVLHRIDREFLQSMYMARLPHRYNEDRIDTTLPVAAKSEDGW